jgi:tRNA (mo5U34)-methyltransferase
MNNTNVSTAEEIQHAVSDLGDWFHNIDLFGVATAPHHALGDYPTCKWRHFASAIPADLRGWTVLDIGCNAGFYSLEMKKRGADRVLGIDSDGRYLAQARYVADLLGVELELEQMSVYEVGRLQEKFDLVLFMGVLYHLRHPLLALDLIHEHVASDTLVVQSMLRGESEGLPLAENYPFAETEIFRRPGYPKMHFVESRYANDPTNWWIPNQACLEGMLRSSGFSITAHPEPEVYVCKYQSARGETQAAYAAKGIDDHG